MRLLPAPIVLLAAAAAALPATAHTQTVDPAASPVVTPVTGPIVSQPQPAAQDTVRERGTYSPGYTYEIQESYHQIKEARKAGRLSKKQAKRLKRQTAATGTAAFMYGSGGIPYFEARDLEMRAQALQSLAKAPGAGTTIKKKKK